MNGVFHAANTAPGDDASRSFHGLAKHLSRPSELRNFARATVLSAVSLVRLLNHDIYPKLMIDGAPTMPYSAVPAVIAEFLATAYGFPYSFLPPVFRIHSCVRKALFPQGRSEPFVGLDAPCICGNVPYFANASFNLQNCPFLRGNRSLINLVIPSFVRAEA